MPQNLTGFVKTYPRAHNTQLNDKCPWTPSPSRCLGHSTTLQPQALWPVAELPQCHSLAVNHARQPAEKISFPGNEINLISHSKNKCPNITLPTGCALDTQQPATHPPTGQYLGCVWVLDLTETPLGFKLPDWLEAGLRPASSENLAAMFLQIQLELLKPNRAGKPKLHQLLLPGPS